MFIVVIIGFTKQIKRINFWHLSLVRLLSRLPMPSILGFTLTLSLFLSVVLCAKSPQVRVGVKFRPEVCDRKTANGDRISLHYIGYLASEPKPVYPLSPSLTHLHSHSTHGHTHFQLTFNWKGQPLSCTYPSSLQFANSRDYDMPLEITLGKGEIVKGWETGMVGMCVGEKRKLTVRLQSFFALFSPLFFLSFQIRYPLNSDTDKMVRRLTYPPTPPSSSKWSCCQFSEQRQIMGDREEEKRWRLTCYGMEAEM